MSSPSGELEDPNKAPSSTAEDLNEPKEKTKGLSRANTFLKKIFGFGSLFSRSKPKERVPESTEPNENPRQPYREWTETNQETLESYREWTEVSVEPSEPYREWPEPGQEPTEPHRESSESNEDPKITDLESTEPNRQETGYLEESTKGNKESTNPSEDQTQPVDDPVQHNRDWTIYGQEPPEITECPIESSEAPRQQPTEPNQLPKISPFKKLLISKILLFRFLPVFSHVTNETPEGSASRKKEFLRKILRFLFSHVGLCILNITYLSVGSVIFIQLEGYQDNDTDTVQKTALNASYRVEARRFELIDQLITDAQYVNQSTIEKWIYDYHFMVIKEKNSSNYRGIITEITPSTKWSFSSVMLFVLSIVSSIGYGHIYPRDDTGYLIVILYGLFGTPFFVMSLGSIGGGLATVIRIAYQKGCCWAVRRRRGTSRQVRPSTVQSHATYEYQPDEPNVSDQMDDFVPLSLAIGTVVLYTILGGLLFSWKEQWDYIPSIYFCVVTLITIGFGDLVPGVTDGNKAIGQLSVVVAMLYIVIGLALVSMTLNVAVDILRGRMSIFINRVKIFDEKDEPDYL